TIEHYVKYRPNYPDAIYSFLSQQGMLKPQHVIADIGSGTGFLAKLFLEQGHRVYGIEPNSGMREAGEEYLAHYPHFYSIDAIAEATTLPENSIDWITAGTAFHWFDAANAKMEFQRILKSPGYALLIWNVRNTQDSPFIKDYEQLIIDYGKDYKNSRAEEFDKTALADFFAPYPMQTTSFVNIQLFDWEGLKGRLLSTSYSLRETDAGYDDMINALKILFDRHQHQGQVEFLYETKLYFGRMK
ncbi:MAG: class I SAM-dependent methyltransferase, partial [Legionellales bacterium]|nr:class I SAM-dependent methyltransferase [Legionellales bacterium]